MAADVLCGVRSYVQTRFLATEDSSTLTIALCVFVLKTYLAQKHTLPKRHITYLHPYSPAAAGLLGS